MYIFHTNDCIIQPRRSAELNEQTRWRHHHLAAECMTGMRVGLFSRMPGIMQALGSVRFHRRGGPTWPFAGCLRETPRLRCRVFPFRCCSLDDIIMSAAVLDRRRWLINGARTSAIPPVFRINLRGGFGAGCANACKHACEHVCVRRVCFGIGFGSARIPLREKRSTERYKNKDKEWSD